MSVRIGYIAVSDASLGYLIPRNMSLHELLEVSGYRRDPRNYALYLLLFQLPEMIQK